MDISASIQHFITDASDLGAVVEKVVRRLSESSDELQLQQSELHSFQSQLDLLRAVLHAVNDRRKLNNQLTMISDEVIQNFNLLMQNMLRKIQRSDGDWNTLLEPLVGVYCEGIDLHQESGQWIIDHCVSNLKSVEDNDQMMSNQRAAIDILNILLYWSRSYPTSKTCLKEHTDMVVELVPLMLETEFLGKFIVIVKRLLSLHDDDQARLKGMIWDTICSRDTKLDDALTVLCTLAEIFVSSNESSVAAYQDQRFWRILQSGLGSLDTLVRKRALYCLKRALDNLASLDRDIASEDHELHKVAIFCWEVDKKKELATLWEDFVLIIEMMEEKQVHVIRPLLPRWQNLVTAASCVETYCNPLLHTSWLLVLLRRTAGHSSAIIVKWGMEQLLELDPAQLPLISQGANDFLTSELAEMMNHTWLYQADMSTPMDTCPVMADKLATFLHSYWAAFRDEHERGEFFNNFLRSIDSVSWSGIPLMFMTRALSLLPNCLILTSSSLDILRNICSRHVRTVHGNQRGAIQVFSTQMIINLIDHNNTTMMDVLRFLAVVRPDESFTRGSRVWKQLCDWLELKPWKNSTDQLESIAKVLHGEEINSIYSDLPKEVLSRGFVTLYLLHLDCGKFVFEPSKLVLPLFELVTSSLDRPYLSRDRADNALDAIVRFLELKGKTPLPTFLQRLLDQSRDSFQEYIVHRLLTCSSLEGSEFLLTALLSVAKLIIQDGNLMSLSGMVAKLSSNAIKETLTDFSEVVMRMMSVRGLAVYVNAIDFISYSLAGSDMRYPEFPISSELIMNFKRPDPEECSVDRQEWTRLVSETIEARWRIIAYNAKHRLGAVNSQDLFDECISSIDEGTDNILEPIMRTVGSILGEVDIAEHSVRKCLGVFWRRLLDCGPCPQSFWPAYTTFVEVCFQGRLMNREDMKDALLDLADKIQVAAASRNGLMYYWTSHWISIQKHVNLKPYVDHLVKMAMFGPVHDKSTKFVLKSNAYIAGLSDFEPGKVEIDHDDYKVRVLMATFLLKLDRDDENDVRLLVCFSKATMEAWREITKTRRRHTFVNSLRHRETHRLLTSLILIHDVIAKNEPTALLDFLCEVLDQEGQPSVRFLAEWILIKYLLKNIEDSHLVWKHLSRGDLKPVVQCSWLTIATHVARAAPPCHLNKFLLRAIPPVLPLCMAHQFNLRIFGQACLLTIWNKCQEQGLENFPGEAVVLESVNNFLSMSGNSSRITNTLLGHFSFVYHPIHDLSIQSLFVTVPRLFGLNQDEWLHPSTFESDDLEFWQSSKSPVRLLNSRTCLDSCQSGAWKLRMKEDDENQNMVYNDVQRKITPWRRMFVDEASQDVVNVRKTPADEGLILVASLVDKNTNLGGLCRSCEIFGTTEFVIGSLSYVEDPMFTGLSVSAQKWISITEVQPNSLGDYLLAQRRRGYTLVGVEQTNKSQCLSQFKFPSKTLLLLGNEKEGIPVDLIQLLDVCVEIPQQGVTRSLNVHVCGAILVWEYRRQHLK